MSGDNNGKKRTHDQHLGFTDVSVGSMQNSFKSKTDILNYWSSMLQVSTILTNTLNPLPI